MPNYDVIFYEKPDGTEPAKEFLLSLDPKMRAKMLKTIDLLAENGNELREPYSKYLEDSIFELRAKVGSDISRVLYFFCWETSGSHKRFHQENAENADRRKRARQTILERLYGTRGGTNMSKYSDFLAEQLTDPAVKAEYDALEPEFAIIQAMIDARKSSGLTQKQLSERTGIAQADISKLESGNANPSLKTLQRLAAGMGMKIKIEFQPIAQI